MYDIQNTGSTWGTQYDALKDLDVVIAKGVETEAWQHVGASKILTALGIGTLTSYYGDIPWSEALKGSEVPSPKFDTQEEIYNAIFSLLNDARTDLDKTSTINLGAEDIAFNGDIAKWKALSYALEARYRNHLSKKDASGSATAALTAIDNAKTNGFTSFAGDLTFKYEGADRFLNGWFHMFENNQMIASEVFMNTLETTNDPRKIAYWNNENTDGVAVGYLGKPNAFGTSNISFSPVGPQGFYGKDTSSQLIVTHFELLFIEAEAAMRSGDADRAATALNVAIKAQLDLVTPASITYLASSGGDVAAYQTQITNYIANFGNETAATVTMEKIMTEKHKAMVTMNGESWLDVRRHDYNFPATLSIPVNAGTPIASEFIQRVPYPQESINTNSKTPSGVGLFDKLWVNQ